MIELNEVDSHINSLLNYLENIQNNDGSFDTMYLQPYYNPDKGWMKFPSNAAYDVACCLIPLLDIKSEQAKLIIEKGKGFILNQAFENKLWSYPKLSDDYPLFYDIDSTALCSFVLERTQYDVANKELLDQFINNGDYNVFIIPKKLIKQLSLLSFIKILLHNRKVKNGYALKNNLMRADDKDFIVSCNSLLYMGETKKNKSVWVALKEKFITKQIIYFYYPTFFQCFYFYARLCAYSGNKDLIPDSAILNEYINELYSSYTREHLQIQRIFLVNAILFLNSDLNKYENLIENCLNDISEKQYKEKTPYYSGNIHTDLQPGTNLPNTYFGSPAITCSLYIEFLNLYRNRFYGSFYGKD